MRIVLLTCLSLVVVALTGSTLTIDITGFKSDDGMVLLSLFNGKDGFPIEPDLAFMEARADIENGISKIVLVDIPSGEYAVSVMHDEDGDNYMDSNLLGIPTEGWGASNNPKSRLGPPRWKDCRFTVGEDDVTISIAMRY